MYLPYNVPSRTTPFTEGRLGVNNKASPPGRHQEQAPKQRCTFSSTTFSSVQYHTYPSNAGYSLQTVLFIFILHTLRLLQETYEYYNFAIKTYSKFCHTPYRLCYRRRNQWLRLALALPYHTIPYHTIPYHTIPGCGGANDNALHTAVVHGSVVCFFFVCVCVGGGGSSLAPVVRWCTFNYLSACLVCAFQPPHASVSGRVNNGSVC